LEEKLEEREREISELRRRGRGGEGNGGGGDNAALRDAEADNAMLVDELENMKALLEENTDEMDRLREIVEQRGGEGDLTTATAGSLKRRVDELEADNDELRLKLDEQVELLGLREEEKDDLADEVDALRLSIEDLQRRREAESMERSQSRAQVLEEREEREAVEDDLNSLRDKLAGVTIELQQREDEVEMKVREIEELVGEHERIVEVVEQEWRGEVEEARGQVEELRDVRAGSSQIYISFTDVFAHTGPSRTRNRIQRTPFKHL
jgi:chromosome segregation ATPase